MLGWTLLVGRPRLIPANGRLTPGEMADFRLGQESPLQGLILTVSLAERQGGFRLHQLVAQVERMGRIRDIHRREELERIGTAEELRIIQCVDLPVLGEDPPVRVLDPSLKLLEVRSSRIAPSLGSRSMTRRGSRCLGSVRCTME